MPRRCWAATRRGHRFLKGAEAYDLGEFSARGNETATGLTILDTATPAAAITAAPVDLLLHPRRWLVDITGVTDAAGGSGVSIISAANGDATALGDNHQLCWCYYDWGSAGFRTLLTNRDRQLKYARTSLDAVSGTAKLALEAVHLPDGPARG